MLIDITKELNRSVFVRQGVTAVPLSQITGLSLHLNRFFGPLWSFDFNIGFKDKDTTNTMAKAESTDFKNDCKTGS